MAVYYDFIQDLYQLAKNCDYRALKEDSLRDRVVVGVVDEGLSDKLQAKCHLTLEGSIQMSRQVWG